MAFKFNAIIPSNNMVDSPKTPSSGFVESIFKAYGDLTKHPLALMVLIISILSILSEINNATGPLELLAKALEAYISSDNPAFLKSLVAIFLGLIKFLITFKAYAFLYSLVGVIPLAYPNLDNPILLLLILLYVTVSHASEYWKILVIQLVFVYYYMPNNFDRLFIFVAIIITIFGASSIASMLAVNI